MSIFKYSEDEEKLNKVLKLNKDISTGLLNDTDLLATRSSSDANIAASMELLSSLGYQADVSAAEKQAVEKAKSQKLEHQPLARTWEEILSEAEAYYPTEVTLEDILSPAEIEAAFREIDNIERQFSRQTSLTNKTDLCFLSVAIALQVAKALLFPYVAGQFGYGESFDPSERMAHDDPRIKKAQREANDLFRDKKLKNNHPTGYWINLLYQTPPDDITKGSTALGINMGGKYHRLYTLGHDPVLGWIFGTANILTDIITLNNFQSYRVVRKPKMLITPERVDILTMFWESYETTKEDFLNLPAAIFAQAQHLKSDEYTKVGLPVPIIETLNENFASALYKEQYDALCFSRDVKIVGVSYMVSLLIDIIISLVHGLFKKAGEDKKLYEVRTRKILLISNAIASTSSVINTCITKNPKNLDIGSLLATLTHLITDTRFIARIKQEFIENEINKRLAADLEELDQICQTL